MPTPNPSSLIQAWSFQIVALFILYFTYLVQCSSKLKDVQEQRHQFESLLAGGRTLAFPFSTGLILTIVSNDKSNWNVSHNGIQEALGLSPEILLQSYSSLVKDMKEDDNVTVSSVVYTIRDGWNHNATSKLISQLEATVTKVEWDDGTSNETWYGMNRHVADATNGIIDGELIPKDTSLGTPFSFSTESVLISTFHYRNYWNTPWTEGGFRQFFDSGDVRFMKLKGEYLFAEEEDFTAVSIPLQGDMKSVVFVFPNVNITKYFQARSQGDGDSDVVPFPKTWQKKLLNILIPSFNLTSTDQYGKELEQLGMNETFCTTLHDRSGKIPYYMRPIVQINAIEVNEGSLEIASATGTAIEKFHLGLDVGGKGYPRLKSQIDSSYAESTPINSTIQQKELLFNRPFLLYLNDTKNGPIFYGIVQNIQNPDEPKTEEDEKLFSEKAEAEKFLLWSCRSFKQTIIKKMEESL